MTSDFQMSDSHFESEYIQNQVNDLSYLFLQAYLRLNRADLFAQAQVDSLRAGGFHPLLLSSRVFPWAPGQQSSGKGKNCCLFLCLGQQYLDLIPFFSFKSDNPTYRLIALCYYVFIQSSHFHYLYSTNKNITVKSEAEYFTALDHPSRSDDGIWASLTRCWVVSQVLIPFQVPYLTQGMSDSRWCILNDGKQKVSLDALEDLDHLLWLLVESHNKRNYVPKSQFVLRWRNKTHKQDFRRLSEVNQPTQDLQHVDHVKIKACCC